MAHPIRLIGPLAFFGLLSPLATAQGVDCEHVPLSAGPVDPAYAACAHRDAAVAPAAPPASSFGYEFGINNIVGWFVSFQQSDPSDLWNVGPYTPPGGGFLNGGDFPRFSATWHAVDHLGQAIKVNSSNGAVTQLGTMGSDWTGVTYDHTTNQFYGLQVTSCGGGSRLYTLDFTTLTATPVGDVDPQNACGTALAAHPFSGQLYTYDLASDTFLRINKATGQSTVIGPIGFDANYGQGMDFDRTDDTCYMYAFNNETFQAELRTVDIYTGATTLVGPLGQGLNQVASASNDTEPIAIDCFQFFSSASVDPVVVPRGGTFDVAMTAANLDPIPQAVLAVLEYNLQGGPPGGFHTLGRGTIPPEGEASATVRVRVPASAPPGAYNLTLKLVDTETGFICDRRTFTLTVTPSLHLRDDGEGGDVLIVEGVADFSARTSTTNSPTVTVSPNPFAQQTMLAFEVTEMADVRLAVYDVLGREVAVLVDSPAEAGAYTMTFDARGLTAGTYLWRLTVGGEVRTGQMTLLR